MPALCPSRRFVFALAARGNRQIGSIAFALQLLPRAQRDNTEPIRVRSQGNVKIRQTPGPRSSDGEMQRSRCESTVGRALYRFGGPAPSLS